MRVIVWVMVMVGVVMGGGHTDGTSNSKVKTMIHGCSPNTFLKEFFKEWSWSVMVMVMVMGGGVTEPQNEP